MRKYLTVSTQHTFQRCLLVDTTSRRRTTSNHRWKNVMCFNVGIYNVEQRWINVAYFNVDMDNIRQRWNNVVIFNIEFHNVGKNRKMLWKWMFPKRTKKKKDILNWIHGIQSFNYYFIIFFTLLPVLIGICRRVLVKPRKLLKDHDEYCIART